MKLSLVIGIIGVVMAGLAAGISIYSTSHTGKLPVIEKAADFKLVNQDNKEVQLSRLSGKVKLLGFSYVRCNKQRACPLTAKQFKQAQDLLKAQYQTQVEFLIITLDPEADTSEALKKYGELYGVDFTNWHFLTGPKETIERTCADYEIIREKLEDGSIRHSVTTFLIDKNNDMRKIYFANEWKPDDARNDIINLIEE